MITSDPHIFITMSAKDTESSEEEVEGEVGEEDEEEESVYSGTEDYGNDEERYDALHRAVERGAKRFAEFRESPKAKFPTINQFLRRAGAMSVTDRYAAAAELAGLQAAALRAQRVDLLAKSEAETRARKERRSLEKARRTRDYLEKARDEHEERQIAAYARADELIAELNAIRAEIVPLHDSLKKTAADYMKKAEAYNAKQRDLSALTLTGCVDLAGHHVCTTNHHTEIHDPRNEYYSNPCYFCKQTPTDDDLARKHDNPIYQNMRCQTCYTHSSIAKWRMPDFHITAIAPPITTTFSDIFVLK